MLVAVSMRRVASVLTISTGLVAISCGGGSGRDESGSGEDGITTLSASDGGTETIGGDGDGGMAMKLDVTNNGDGGGGGDCNAGGGGMMGDDAEFSYIWIANSSQGTVSKVDTRTTLELGRYEVRENTGPSSPSRTSVNEIGDVAVSLRGGGGVTKILADSEECPDLNGVPGIQTSTGAGDILPWGTDECVAWHTAFPGKTESRAIAWTSGVLDEGTCLLDDVNVWVAGSNNNGAGSVSVYYVNGDTGAVETEVGIPELAESWPGWHTLYGGAVDADNNFYATQLENGTLVRVNADDFTYNTWAMGGDIGYGGYGMTISADGYVWVCGRTIHRFDPASETWTANVLTNDASPHTGGCFPNGDGVVYKGQYGQIVGINTETLQPVSTWDVAEAGDDFIWGVAVDFDGFVWGIPRNGSKAYKIDPMTGMKVGTMEGLVGAYTYSDMTGFGLFSVNNPPAG